MPLGGRLALTILVAAAPIFIILILNQLDQRESRRANIVERAEIVAGQTASREDHFVTAARFLLTSISHLEEVQTFNSAACQLQLRAIVSQLPEIVGAAVLTPKGDTACSSTGSRVNLSDRSYFQAALQSGEFTVSGHILGRVTGRGSLIFTYPAKSESAVEYIMLLAISSDALSAALADPSLPPDTFIMLIDAEARVMAYWPDPEKWVGRDLSNTDWAHKLPKGRRGGMRLNLEGERSGEYALGYAPMRAPAHATVIVGLPVGPALREVEALFWRSIALTGLVFLAAIAAALLGARFLVQRPINALSERINALASGREADSLSVRGLPEMRNLSDHFTRMAHSLVARQAELKEALQQKEMLLKEVNHRVKNSLQLVASLFSLQRSRIADSDVRGHFDDATQRVNTVARVHQRLYQDQHLDSVAFDKLLKELCQELHEALGRPGGPGLECSAVDCRLPTDKAIPLALIVNELVTNAYKYAYAESASGLIRVECRLQGNDLLVEVADDGVPLPPDFDPARSEGLGMQVISALVKQLRGKTEIVRRTGGKSFVLRVPIEGHADA